MDHCDERLGGVSWHERGERVAGGDHADCSVVLGHDEMTDSVVQHERCGIANRGVGTDLGRLGWPEPSVDEELGINVPGGSGQVSSRVVIQYFMSDKKLNELREQQRHLRSVVDEYAARDLPFPSVVDWSPESRRMIEVAIRLRCEMEAGVSTDVIARIESNRCHHLFERLVDQDSIAGPLTMNEPRFRAVEILKSVAGEQRYEAVAGDDVAVVRRLAYLLQVADRIASGGA